MTYGVKVELLPRVSDVKDDTRWVLHLDIFDTVSQAQDYIDRARRQNLPFRSTRIVELHEV